MRSNQPEYEAYCYLRDYGAHLGYLTSDERRCHAARSSTQAGAVSLLLSSKYVRRFVRNNRRVPPIYVRVWTTTKSKRLGGKYIMHKSGKVERRLR